MLISEAQELVVIDPEAVNGPSDNMIPIVPLELPNDTTPSLEVMDSGSPEVVLELGELPGAPDGTPDPVYEEPLEVSEPLDEEKPDENDAKSKKDKKWDWESRGAHGFVDWVKEMFDAVPKHSGTDSAGCERAISYLEKLDSEISRAMRSDLDGSLDSDKIEKIRAQIEDGISRLYNRLDKIKKTSKKRRKKTSDFQPELVKEGQKITGVKGVYVTVPLLISGIGRICINAMVSAGHDIERVYHDQVKKWKLNDREKAEVRWFLYDMGYPMRGDRGFMPDEDVDAADTDNYDWMQNFRS